MVLLAGRDWVFLTVELLAFSTVPGTHKAQGSIAEQIVRGHFPYVHGVLLGDGNPDSLTTSWHSRACGAHR